MWLYSIFSFFDYAVYSMVRFCVRLIMLIANYDFFDENTIGLVAKKIYIILGVLMMFKLVISAIQYMINPDTFDDKEKGISGLLTKMVISMALLVLINPIFNFAMYMQKSIVSTIPGLILDSGDDFKLENTPAMESASNYSPNDPLAEIGDKVAGSTIMAFVSLKSDRVDKIKSDEDMSDGKLESFRKGILSGCDGSVIPFKGFDVDLCNYNYVFGLSTAAGLFLLYVMVGMMLDVGIRSIKLGILQIFAPIPISSYIVSKDKLTKFGKLALKVYTDLFIRLGIIYFIVFFIREIIDNMGNSVTVGNYTASSFETAFIKVAIIVALFMFAKNAPTFICEVLGIDGGGFGEISDMFKSPLQRTGGLAGLGAAIGAFRNSRSYGEGAVTSVGRALGAGTHATASRLKAIASGKDLAESYKDAKSSAMERTNKNLEYANRYQKFWQRQGKKIGEKFDAYTGVTTGGKKSSSAIEAANRAIKARGNAWNRAQDKVGEHADRYNGGTITDSMGNTLGFEEMYALFERNADEMYAGQKIELASQYQSMKDQASLDFLRQSFAGVAAGTGDGQVRNVFSEDVFSIARSGADSRTVERLLNREITVSSGAVVKVEALKAADRINQMNQIREDTSLSPAEKAARLSALEFSADEAEALAIFASEMQRAGGTVRLEATKTQVSEPKS